VTSVTDSILTRAEPSAPAAASALQAVRSRNRFELKYLLPRERAAILCDEALLYMEPDAHGLGRPYVITSLYYDTPDLRCYWEKVDGLKCRRKLRIRHYENAAGLQPDTPVFVEIKQRLNRTTQKRRAKLPYSGAVALCRGEDIEHDASQARFIHEVRAFVGSLRLEPASITSYYRRALVGTIHDPGLRITFDTDIRYRSADLSLESRNPGLHMVPPEQVVVEIKANDHIPRWVTALVGAHNAQVVRISKYCQSVEVAGRAPRSAFHLPETEARP
jgi:SPX domain protein involved in polyphosphate accumulation